MECQGTTPTHHARHHDEQARIWGAVQRLVCNDVTTPVAGQLAVQPVERLASRMAQQGWHNVQSKQGLVCNDGAQVNSQLLYSLCMSEQTFGSAGTNTSLELRRSGAAHCSAAAASAAPPCLRLFKIPTPSMRKQQCPSTQAAHQQPSPT